MYKTGFGKSEMNLLIKGVGMLGYGAYHNKVKGMEIPLCVRAMYILDGSGGVCCFVNAELCFITPNIKSAVAKKIQEEHSALGLNDDNLMITAQHTHSAPGGYSFHGFYNISIPGFVPEVFGEIVRSITEAIVSAASAAVPSELRITKGVFPDAVPVAFNRSIAAFNANPETPKYRQSEHHLAVDRGMTVLRVDSTEGKPLGIISWFGVHTTSISNDNTLISSDNKGYASFYCEEKYRHQNENFTAIFAQAPCGDITPNYVWDSKKKWTRGKFENDFESAKFNGHLQFELADSLFSQALTSQQITGAIDCIQNYSDFSSVTIDTQYTEGKYRTTGKPVLGVAFLVGTKEGPGIPAIAGGILRIGTTLVKWYELGILAPLSSKRKRAILHLKYKTHKNKHLLIETASRRIMGTGNLKGLILPGFADKVIYYMKQFYQTGAMQQKIAWTPHILPIQLLKIGSLILAGSPGELTTVAGWRLAKTLSGYFPGSEIVNSPYANAYCGYITTREEYEKQLYEGGHTVFGEWTLAAFQTRFGELCKEFLKNKAERAGYETEPEEFDDQYIEKWKSPEAALFQ
ncbi:MAG: neutral/alkaline non-lysosomal ceramidase N-terminal domain-containing protein [Bacteroidia bacterium]|nr:neutral/alkaline non-lysosomal ceramidase N-terminal domain-containing protein [Bacteroidia bacterium]